MISLLLSCSEPPPPPPGQQLAQASEQVIFASVETLGAHLFRSTSTREELRGERLESRHVESVEIRWQDWDNFSQRRLVDGKAVNELIVKDHRAWKKRSSGGWAKKNDAEPYRVQLRSSWNAWDQAISPFKEDIEWLPVSTEELEGRETQRYRLALSARDEGEQSSGLRAIRLEGDVWVDQRTAVRILGDVEGELVGKDGYRRTFSIKVNRSLIGEDQGITAPASINEKRVNPENEGP
jgi:hypothetical protein